VTSAAPAPSVAVVVPTRSRPEELRRAVAAILGQSYPGEVECVVVADQCDPAGVDLAGLGPPGTGSRRLRVLANDRTPGLAGARNTGMLATSSELIAFCDDDDEWRPGKLAAQAELLARPASGFAATGIRVRYAGRAVDRIPPPAVGLADLVRDRITALHPSTFCLRRAVLERIGLVDERLPASYAEDYDWLLRAARLGPVVAVTEPLVEVHWHAQSYFASRWESIAQALGYLLDKHPELHGDRAGLARIQGQIAFAQAAGARRPAAFATSWRAIRNNPAERRAYLALAVAAGVLPAGAVVRAANRRGRGI